MQLPCPICCMHARRGLRTSVMQKKLNSFHLCCLLKLLCIQWQDKIPDTEVLSRASMPSIFAPLHQSQLCWAGHVTRTPNKTPQTYSLWQADVWCTLLWWPEEPIQGLKHQPCIMGVTWHKTDQPGVMPSPKVQQPMSSSESKQHRLCKDWSHWPPLRTYTRNDRSVRRALDLREERRTCKCKTCKREC